MIGAPGLKGKAPKEPVPAKAYKGNLVDLFKQPPVDVTIEKSKYETYTQAQATVDPVEIVIDRTRSWTDLTKLLFEYEVGFTANNGTTLLTNTAEVAPINNIGHSLIKQFQVLINNSPISINSENYFLEAYFDRLVNYSETEKNSWLSLEGWYTDDPGKFDTANPIDTPLGSLHTTVDHIKTWLNRVPPNHGAKKRHALCCQGRHVKFILSPVIPLFSCKRYLPPGCELKFRIHWNPAALALMSSDTTHTTPKFKIIPYSPKIHLWRLEANSELHVAMENEMLSRQRIAIFPHFGTRIVTHTIPNGRRRAEMMNIFQGYCPNYMMIGFLPSAALTGDYTLSPFNFIDRHQSSVKVTRDGEELPFQRLEVADSHYREDAYNTILRFSGQGINSGSIGISREAYKDGNYLLMYNFNPDGELNFNYDYERNNGNVNISVDFSQNTNDNITIVVIGYFEQQGWLDGNKNWTLRYSH